MTKEKEQAHESRQKIEWCSPNPWFVLAFSGTILSAMAALASLSSILFTKHAIGIDRTLTTEIMYLFFGWPVCLLFYFAVSYTIKSQLEKNNHQKSQIEIASYSSRTDSLVFAIWFGVMAFLSGYFMRIFGRGFGEQEDLIRLIYLFFLAFFLRGNIFYLIRRSFGGLGKTIDD